METSIGLLAAGLVLATFSARNFLVLRSLAVASNVAFLAYAALLSLWPVLALHAILLPLNLAHLLRLIRRRPEPKSPGTVPAAPSYPLPDRDIRRNGRRHLRTLRHASRRQQHSKPV